jgi:hypothetical protein
MPLFGRKKIPPPKSIAADSPAAPSEADLADAARLMDRWDAALGNSNAIWSCIEAIARRGGFRGAEATLMEVMDGENASDVSQRPWRWWNEAARLAQAAGDDVLAGRIFLFTHLFATQTVPNMRPIDMMDTGLEQPWSDTYQSIARTAVASLARLAPDFLIHDTATGKMDVASALRLAEAVSGITEPQARARRDSAAAESPLDTREPRTAL